MSQSSTQSEEGGDEPRLVRILTDDETCPELPIVEGEGGARAVVWPGNGARLRSFHHIFLGPRAKTVPLSHPMESVYYVKEGSVTAVDADEAVRHQLVLGSMVHIDPGTTYSFEAADERAEILGGPCPADPAMYAHLEAQ